MGEAVRTVRNMPRKKALVNGVVFDDMGANHTQTYSCVGRESTLTITKPQTNVNQRASHDSMQATMHEQGLYVMRSACGIVLQNRDL